MRHTGWPQQGMQLPRKWTHVHTICSHSLGRPGTDTNIFMGGMGICIIRRGTYGKITHHLRQNQVVLYDQD